MRQYESKKKRLLKVIAVICVLFYIIYINYERPNINFNNKSLGRETGYLVDIPTGSNIFHISFDDVIVCFEDITLNEYFSIFENDFFFT